MTKMTTFSNSTLLHFANGQSTAEFQELDLSVMKDEFEKKVKNISDEIEALKAKEPALNYIECAVEICQKYDVDMDSLKKVLSKNIKEKIEMDAMNLNLLTYRNNTLL